MPVLWFKKQIIIFTSHISDYLRALERQLATNPVLRRTIDDAIEQVDYGIRSASLDASRLSDNRLIMCAYQDEYEREYGGDEYGRGGRRTTSPPMM